MQEHTVALLERGKPKRVTCRVCGGEHLFRPEPPKGRAKVPDPLADVPSDWDALLAAANLERIRPYSMRQSYGRGDVIRHKVFGLGIVVREAGRGKVEVSFRDGTRLLACDRRR